MMRVVLYRPLRQKWVVLNDCSLRSAELEISWWTWHPRWLKTVYFGTSVYLKCLKDWTLHFSDLFSVLFPVYNDQKFPYRSFTRKSAVLVYFFAKQLFLPLRGKTLVRDCQLTLFEISGRYCKWESFIWHSLAISCLLRGIKRELMQRVLMDVNSKHWDSDSKLIDLDARIYR